MEVLLKKPFCLCAIALLMFSSVVFLFEGVAGETGSWETMSPMPTPRAMMGTAVLDNIIYVIGGITGEMGNSVEVAANEAYDPLTNTWSVNTPMPTPRMGLVAVAFNGKIFAIGGYNYTGNPSVVHDIVEVYDPVSDSWTPASPMPAPRTHSEVAVHNGRIFVIGGTLDGSSMPTDEVLAYDPVGDSWSYETPLNIGRQIMGAATLNDKFYLFGGWNGRSDVEEYDPATGNTQSMNALPFGVSGPGAASIGDRIYIAGGSDENECDVISLTYEYDPLGETYDPVSLMPTPRASAGVGVVNGKMYVIGGVGPSIFCEMEAVNEEFTPPQPQNNHPIVDITSPTNGQFINDTIEIQGTASDLDGDSQIEKVEINIDDRAWLPATGTTSWSYTWLKAEFSLGNHIIVARAFDGHNYSEIDWVTVRIGELGQIAPWPPRCNITSPASDENVEGVVTIQGTAYDPDMWGTVMNVEVRIDDGDWRHATGTNDWSYEWNALNASAGKHVIHARAFDGFSYSESDWIIVWIEDGGEGEEIDALPYLLAAIIVVLVALLLLLFYRMKRISKPE